MDVEWNRGLISGGGGGLLTAADRNSTQNAFPSQYIIHTVRSPLTPVITNVNQPVQRLTPLSSPRSSLTKFCRRDNIDQCISFLDKELTMLGFPSLYITNNTNKGPDEIFDIVQLINSTNDLLQNQRKSAKIREDLEIRNQRSENDLSFLQTSNTRLKEDLHHYQKDLNTLYEKERQLNNKNSMLAGKLRSEKEEVKKLKGIIKQRDNQYKHELKKKEKEGNYLKERINQLLTDKNQERRVGMDILNSIQRADGKRGTWKTQKTGNRHEEEMYRLIILNYEERQKELMSENQSLRESLGQMLNELIELFNQQQNQNGGTSYITDEDNFSFDTSTISPNELSIGHFEMPFEMVREEIENSMKENFQKLKEYMKISVNKTGTVPVSPFFDRSSKNERERLEKENRFLKSKIKHYKGFVEEQEQQLILQERKKNYQEKKVFLESQPYQMVPSDSDISTATDNIVPNLKPPKSINVVASPVSKGEQCATLTQLLQQSQSLQDKSQLYFTHFSLSLNNSTEQQNEPDESENGSSSYSSSLGSMSPLPPKNFRKKMSIGQSSIEELPVGRLANRMARTELHKENVIKAVHQKHTPRNSLGGDKSDKHH